MAGNRARVRRYRGVKSASPLRILMSQEAIGKWSAHVGAVLGERKFLLLSTDDEQATSAEVAFVTRDVTGLSTKHTVLPDTQRVYDLLRAAEGLRWVHIHSAGADRPIFVELRERGVAITTSSGANALVVAQSAVLGLLALARHWPSLLEAQRERRWSPLIATGLPRDLQGQRAVVVGWGPVGKEVGRLLRAFGIDVIVVRRSAAGNESGFETVPVSRLREVLPQADWLLLACPLTPQTRGLIGEAELALMPRHGRLINVARGELIDQEALVEFLRTGRIAGAYLDVFCPEPLPKDSPLWELPNVIVTPHSAGFSDGNQKRVAQMFLDNLDRWAQGKPLLNRVAGGSAQ